MDHKKLQQFLRQSVAVFTAASLFCSPVVSAAELTTDETAIVEASEVTADASTTVEVSEVAADTSISVEASKATNTSTIVTPKDEGVAEETVSSENDETVYQGVIMTQENANGETVPDTADHYDAGTLALDESQDNKEGSVEIVSEVPEDSSDSEEENALESEPTETIETEETAETPEEEYLEETVEELDEESSLAEENDNAEVNPPEGGTGWVEEDGEWYYYENESLFTGGVYWIEDGYYRFNEDGSRVSGWYEEDDSRYYYDAETGKAVNGIVTIDGEIYYFNYDGQISPYTQVEQDNICYIFDENGKADLIQDLSKDGWTQSASGNYYYVQNNTRVCNKAITINDQIYVFDYSGKMYANTEIGIYNSETSVYEYYRLGADGAAERGWYTSDTEYDWIWDSELQENIQVYYTYYYDSTTGVRARGPQKVDGVTYVFDSQGCLQKKRSVSSYNSSTHEWGYFRGDENGVMITGWYNNGSTEYPEWYYYDPNTGAAYQNVKTVNGSTYYFSESGYMYTDIVYEDSEANKLYYFGEDGKKTSQDVDTSNDGWQKVGENWYYIQDSHLLKEQFLENNGHTYYLGSDGKRYSDTQSWIGTYNEKEEYISGYFCFDENGEMIKGWYINDDNDQYYYDPETGKAISGLQTLEGELYYFHWDGRLARNYSYSESQHYYTFGEDGKNLIDLDLTVDGWAEDKNGDFYYVQNYSYVSGKILKIDGQIYGFDSSGKMYANEDCSFYNQNTGTIDNYHFGANGAAVKGWYQSEEYETQWDEELGEYVKVYYFYYYDLETSVKVYGPQNIDGVNYVIDSSGRLRKNTVISIYNAPKQVYNYYRADENGVMITGWYNAGNSEMERWCYYDPVTGVEYHNLKIIDGSIYFFQPGGSMLVNAYYENPEEKKLYYFGEDGKAISKEVDLSEDGWKTLEENWFYVRDSRLLRDQFLQDNGHTYYLDGYGKMVTDSQTYIGFYNDQNEYVSGYFRFNENGEMIKGWYTDENENQYYYDLNTGKAVSGLQTVEGETYYFNWRGRLAKNTSYNLDDHYYIFGEDGKLVLDLDLNQDGWAKDKNGEYYYVQEHAYIAGKTLEINGKIYGFDGRGKMYADQEADFYNSETGQWDYYRFGSNGAAVTGWYQSEEYETQWDEETGDYVKNYYTYYYDPETGIRARGPQTIEGKLYVLNSNGRLYRNSTVSIYNNKLRRYAYYRADEDGVAVTGWYKTGSESDPTWYYYDTETGIAYQGIQTVNGKQYVFRYDGRMGQNETVSYRDEDGNTVYSRADRNGYVITGWYNAGSAEDQEWYYYDPITKQSLPGIQTVNGVVYCFASDGEMLVNEVRVDNDKLYYFGKDGKLQTTQELSTDGWKQMPNGWYYVKDSELIRNRILKSGDYTYGFDSSGLMITDAQYELYDEAEDEYAYYRFDASGHMWSGWYQDDEEWYYYDPATGKAFRDMQQVNGKDYYFNYNGRMLKNATYVTDQTLNYYGEDGVLTKSADITKDGWIQMPDAWYYAKDGSLVNGWLTVNGNKYYFSSYKMLADTTRWIWDSENDRDTVYRFNESGAMVTGWYQEPGSGNWYWYNTDGKAGYGIVTVNGKEYLFSDDGRMAENEAVEYLNDNGSYVYSRVDKAGNIVTGWYNAGTETNPRWFYYDPDTKQAKRGMQTVNGSTYYFTYEGRMQTDYVRQQDKKLYYFGDDGKLSVTEDLSVQGWKHLPNGWYYAKDTYLVTGRVLKIGDYTYGFDDDGRMLSDVMEWLDDPLNDDGDSYQYHQYRFDEAGHMVTGWYNDGSTLYPHWYYFNPSNGRGVSGSQTINGKTYYFSSGEMKTELSVVEGKKLNYYGADGVLTSTSADLTVSGWKQMPDGWYYARNNDLVRNDWVESGSSRYYMNSRGRMLTDTTIEVEIYDEEQDTDTWSYYRFDANGKMVTGWYNEGSERHPYWYYYGSDGQGATGIQKINGTWYYFYDDGQMRKGVAREQDHVLYYFGEDGKGTEYPLESDGWLRISNGDYYFVKDKSLLTGWEKIGNIWYYFGSDGRMYSDEFFNEWSSDDEEIVGVYRFEKSGQMLQSRWYQMEDGAYYYFDGSGKAVNGYQTINGKNYCFMDHMMASDCYAAVDGVVYKVDAGGNAVKASDGWVWAIKEGSEYEESSNGKYYVKNGKVLTGWQKIDNSWYYFDTKTGKAYTNQNEIDGKKYYFDSTGVMRTGWLQTDDTYVYAGEDGALINNSWQKINGTWYYFDGIDMVTGIKKVDGEYQLFTKGGAWQGKLKAEKNSWYSHNGDWYYLSSTGKFLAGTCETINGAVYGFDNDGVMQKNCFFDDYYLGSNGKAYQNTWKRSLYNGELYYYGADSKRVENQWLKINGKWSYFNEYGEAATSDKVIDGKLYKFNSDGTSDGIGAELKSGWNLVDGYYYYYYNGKLLTGDQTIGGKKYSFSDNYKMYFATIGYDDNDNACYYKQDGSLAVSEWVDGNTHNSYYRVYADQNGKLVEGLQTINGKNYFFTGYRLATGNHLSEDGKKLYVVDPETKEVTREILAEKDGWMKVNNSWYYVSSGEFVTGTRSINGKKYYFNVDSGMMQINAEQYNGTIDADGVLDSSDGWHSDYYMLNGKRLYGAHTINGKYYYFNDNNTDGLFLIDGAWYYYDGNGSRTRQSLQDGWNKIGGYWYFAMNGRPIHGLQEINGKLYCFGYTDSRMDTNQFYDYYDGLRFMVDENGCLATGWKKWNNKWYYFNEFGVGVDGIRTIDGKRSCFKNGLWLGYC